MHSMTFWWGVKIEDLVIKGVHAEDAWGLTLLCISLIGLCLLYEAIKLQQARVRLTTLQDRFKVIACQPPNESATLLTAAELSQQRQQQQTVASTSTGTPQVPPRVVFHDPAPRQRLVQLSKEALIFLFQGVLGYFLMLAVMSYNAPIFIAVVVGMALGYFLFGHFTMGLNMQSQTLSHTTFKCSTNCPNGESLPPAFASTSTIIPALSRDPTTTSNPTVPAMDENQNMALKKLHSVAEGLAEQATSHAMQQSDPPAQSHSCCA